MDMDQRLGGLAGRSGRIILLGDGTEVLTDAADGEMFDSDEEKDLANQVQKGSTGPDETRAEREETPGPSTGGGDKASQTEVNAAVDTAASASQS